MYPSWIIIFSVKCNTAPQYYRDVTFFTHLKTEVG